MAGVTLLEIMVVMVIAALLGAAVVVMAVPGDRRLQRDMERFDAMLHYTAEQALIEGRTLGIRMSDAGYSFWTFDEQGWRTLDQPPWQPRRWSEPMQWSLDGEPVADTASPQLVFLGSGESIPFRLDLRAEQDQAQHWRFTGDGFGAPRAVETQR